MDIMAVVVVSNCSKYPTNPDSFTMYRKVKTKSKHWIFLFRQRSRCNRPLKTAWRHAIRYLRFRRFIYLILLTYYYIVIREVHKATKRDNILDRMFLWLVLNGPCCGKVPMRNIRQNSFLCIWCFKHTRVSKSGLKTHLTFSHKHEVNHCVPVLMHWKRIQTINSNLPSVVLIFSNWKILPEPFVGVIHSNEQLFVICPCRHVASNNTTPI
jgi:hypothetical protein